MNQGIVPFVKYYFSRILVSVAVLLVAACAADEPEQMPAKQDKPVRPEEAIQVREWYPTPKHQDTAYYVFAPAPGQRMQQQQIVSAPPAQPAQGYNASRQPWNPAPYPVQQGMPQQYTATGGWSGYGQPQLQPPVPQPQYQQPYQPVAPPYPQNYPAQPPLYQPYNPVQPQYQPAQRPWGAADAPEYSNSTGRQSMDTWQNTNQFPAWAPPAYNGYTGQEAGQFGTIQNNVAPGYYR